jgi:hypothetical protein
MFLGVEPSHLASVKFHGYLAATGYDHALEGNSVTITLSGCE